MTSRHHRERREVTVLLGDPRLPDASKPGGRYTADDLDQIVRLKHALGELKETWSFRYVDDHQGGIEALREARPRLVANFCDTGYRNDAAKELHLAAWLEMLDLPYTGSGPVCLGMCYDKALVRAVAVAEGVSVPRETRVPAGSRAVPAGGYPAFVKPNRGDGSLGIDEGSLVASAEQARARVAALHESLPGADLLVQEYLEGDEYGVGIVGNRGAGYTVLPVLEVDYSRLAAELPRILTYGSKVDPESPYWAGLAYREARIDERARERLEASAIALFERLGFRDYGRFDFRADAGGEPRLLEANPNPAWCWDGKLALMAGFAGKSHGDLLRLILEAAETRCFG
jgi:D-alanine-D-alanine ligase